MLKIKRPIMTGAIFVMVLLLTNSCGLFSSRRGGGPRRDGSGGGPCTRSSISQNQTESYLGLYSADSFSNLST